MIVVATSTALVVDVNGVPARVWEAVTVDGVPCFLLVARVGVREDRDRTAFERDLQESAPPSPEASRVFPFRVIV